MVMFLYRNNTEVVRHSYSKATGPDSYKRHSHITDITKLGSDTSSHALPSKNFITELRYHKVVTRLFTVWRGGNSGKLTKALLQNLKYLQRRKDKSDKTEAGRFFIYSYSNIFIVTTSRQTLH